VFHNVLVGIDDSPASHCALEQAIEIAQSSNARLTILTAVGRLPAMASATGDAGTVAQLTQDLEAAALERLEAAVAQVPDDVPVTKLVSFKPSHEALLARAATGCHDLVVVGTRGRGRVRTALFGSVSRHLVQHCDVPVLVVHAERARPLQSNRSVGVTRPEELLA
jgi:nucleotide-binding universal stress UspA family protein